MSVAADTTTDALFGGALRVVQPRSGYRFNVDALWLAAFATRGRPVRHLVDLGAGVGVVTLAAAHLAGVSRATLVEADLGLAKLCEENLLRAGIPARVIQSDLARGLPELRADLVVSNPPYFETNERRPARADREPSRAGALAPFVKCAARALGGGSARAAFVYPARSLARLLALAEGEGLTAKRMRFVHPFASEPARVVLIELKRAKPGGLTVEAPLVEWLGRGEPGPELRALNRAGGRS